LFFFLGKQCQVPEPITNGMVLSKKDLFYYNDDIQFTCNHGYLLSGSAVTNTRCSANGTWADAIPTCTRKKHGQGKGSF
jgi:hypothetical protein